MTRRFLLFLLAGLLAAPVLAQTPQTNLDDVGQRVAVRQGELEPV